jgi:nucleoside-diphosphate-sugar epimerase
MRVLIIGGGGLLGTHLVSELENLGHVVALCDNFTGSIKYRIPKEHRIFSTNAADLNALQHVFKVFAPEVVVLALAYVFPRDTIYSFFDDCRLVLDSANVVSMLLNRDVKKVYFCSSGEVYGGPQTSRPLKETRKIIQGATHHGVAKHAAEKVLSFRCNELGIPLTILRIFDMFGPRIVFSPKTDVINFLIDGFLRGETLGLVGARRQRDFIHVNDVVSAFLGVFSSEFEGALNIGTGKGTSLRQISTALCSLMEVSNKPVELPDSRLTTFSAVANIDLLSSVVPGWAPEKDVLEHLPGLIDFRRKEAEFYSGSNPVGVLNAMRGIK